MSTKFCLGCRQEKSINEFSKDKKSKDGLCYYCKSCMTERFKKHYYANIEKERVKCREYQQLHPERHKEWLLNHPDYKYFPKDILKHVLTKCVSRAKHSNILYDEVNILYNELKPMYDIGECDICHKKIDTNMGKGYAQNNNTLSIDRIIPSKGYTSGNVTILCLECNRKKGNMTLEEMKYMINWLENKLQNNITQL